jgi:hypothetical protein
MIPEETNCKRDPAHHHQEKDIQPAIDGIGFQEYIVMK